MKIQHPHDSGFSLVEVTMALGIATFCLTTIFGLLPVGINSNQNAVQQTTAANLARSVISDMRATPVASGTNNFATSTLFGFQIPAAGQGGNVSSIQTVYFAESANATGAMGSAPVANPTSGSIETSASRYRVTVVFTPPATGVRMSTAVRVRVTWPALADQNPSKSPSNYSGSYETFTLLDRN